MKNRLMKTAIAKKVIRIFPFNRQRYDDIARGITIYEVRILRGLLDAPFPLKLFEAYRLACGEKVDGELVICSEEFAKKLIKNGLIRLKEDGYVLTRTAERMLRSGIFDKYETAKIVDKDL